MHKPQKQSIVTSVKEIFHLVWVVKCTIKSHFHFGTSQVLNFYSFLWSPLH